MLTREKALSIYDYCPISGVVTSKINRRQAKIGTVLGSPHGTGYLTVWYVNKNYFIHRVIWLMVYGEWPEQVDHIDGDRSNNRIQNLRKVTPYENSKNRNLSKANKSGFNGVRQLPNGSWKAYTVYNYRQIHLGCFNKYEDAVNARKEYDARHDLVRRTV